MKTQKGFTLIELLVVIAIIGILSSVVLASLNTARAKGSDAAIKADLASIRAQAAIFYDANNLTYGDDTSSCSAANTVFVDPTITQAISHAQTASGGTATCYADDGSGTAGSAATSWAISIPLKSSPTTSWCVDSTGVSASGTAALASNVALCQ